MYVLNNIDSLEVLIRKQIFGFMERLNNNDNKIITSITNSGYYDLIFGVHGRISVLYNNIFCHNFYILFICHVITFAVINHGTRCILYFITVITCSIYVLSKTKYVYLYLSLYNGSLICSYYINCVQVLKL